MFRDSDYELINYRPEHDVSGRMWWLAAAIVCAIAALMWNELFAMICLGLMCVCVFAHILTEPKIIPEQYIVRFTRELTEHEWSMLNKYYHVDGTDPNGILICTKKEET